MRGAGGESNDLQWHPLGGLVPSAVLALTRSPPCADSLHFYKLQMANWTTRANSDARAPLCKCKALVVFDSSWVIPVTLTESPDLWGDKSKLMVGAVWAHTVARWSWKLQAHWRHSVIHSSLQDSFIAAISQNNKQKIIKPVNMDSQCSTVFSLRTTAP